MSASSGAGAAQQLEQLRQQVAQGNPELYRHWALYLQVLREGLGGAVDQACFQLAVGVYPERYQRLDAGKRQQLHRRMAALVRRSCALLTVEQLQALAIQMQQRQRRQMLRARRQWLQRLQDAPLSGSEASGAVSAEEPVPQGSVHLGLALPISATFFGMQPAAAPDQGDPSEQANDAQAGVAPLEADSAAGEQEAAAADLVAVFTRLLDDAGAEPGPGTPKSKGMPGLLPDEPTALLAWIEGLEAALGRRLRTLSHGLNVELARLGLSSTLLPLRLLEAVAAGQIESQNTAANLVRLSIPMPEPAASAALETQALLLRPADLEAEQLRLRTCRGRLQQARQELRRMAQTYQRLEQRLQVQQAEQLWLNDHSTAQRQQPTI
ncbi:MAG: hypothetical protein VKL97_05340 [Cyanobacteriota bacterium]|nr:hypothetical protein [Cyanobacteriota bacterium]